MVPRETITSHREREGVMRRRRKNIKSPFNVPEDSFFVRLWLLHPLLGRNEGRFNCRQMKEMFVLRFTSDTTTPTLLHLVVGGSVAQTHRKGGGDTRFAGVVLAQRRKRGC